MALSIAITRAFHHSSPSSDTEMIISQQPDFVEQKSSVQEVVEEAGHLCIFLPKFHCELNFIEFFWGPSRNIFGSIVITPLKLSRQTFQKHLSQFKSVPYGSRTQDDSVDGGIQGGKECKGCTI